MPARLSFNELKGNQNDLTRAKQGPSGGLFWPICLACPNLDDFDSKTSFFSLQGEKTPIDFIGLKDSGHKPG